MLEPDAARDRRPPASCPSRRSPASRPTATTSTSSATRACCRVRWDGSALDARRRVHRPLPHRSTARPTAGTASSPRARRGSSTTATAASATPARSAATASRPRRCTSCASTSTPGAVDDGRGLRAAGRPRRQPAGRRRATAASPSATTAATACSPAFDRRRRSTPRWRRDQDHASHLLLYADTGELVTGRRTPTSSSSTSRPAHELARADTGSGIQSVLFPAPGFDTRLLRLLVPHRVARRCRVVNPVPRSHRI